jgi:hypothetical protein
MTSLRDGVAGQLVIRIEGKKMRALVASSLLFLCLFLGISQASAQISVGISVSFGPPALPIYEQPICPADGYLWVPGYWAYDNDYGYYWVPGTWVQAPQVGYLWTPGYWGWGGSAFIFHEGYWGPQVGFYGGIVYGFGYGGVGYEGGRWDGNRFLYNTYVSHVNTTIIHNTYNVRVTNITENHISYNGGSGGITARATAQEEAYSREQHVGPVAAQTQHIEAARGNPELRATANHGVPSVAATARPGDFKTGAVASRQAGGEYKPPPSNAAAGKGEPPNSAQHASELKPHTFTPPNTGNPATDKKYQQQQNNLAATQAQDHQKLQQQQEKEHQQAAAKNYPAPQKAQMEQRHTQQTQQVEQKHAVQQQHLQQRQAPSKQASKPEEKPR